MPPDRIDVFRYDDNKHVSDGDYWSLTIPEAEALLEELTEALITYCVAVVVSDVPGCLAGDREQVQDGTRSQVMKWEVTVYPYQRKRLTWLPERKVKKIIIEAETGSDALDEAARTQKHWYEMRARRHEAT